jgi:hypothetical protein
MMRQTMAKSEIKSRTLPVGYATFAKSLSTKEHGCGLCLKST